jgi:hypothetical protein
VEFEVGEVTAGATFYMAEIYREFSESLLDSERPGGLTEAEMLQYELVLEEEAYPFEELAIEVHQKNLELMSAGVYNAWIERSLGELAVLMPGRYAKFEVSTGLLASIDTYAYRASQARAARSGLPQGEGPPAASPEGADPEPDGIPLDTEPPGPTVEAS